MHVLRSHQLTVLTTNNCTAACAHCCMSSLPGRTGRRTFEQLCRYIDEALEASEVDLVIFAGGEPLLLGNDLDRAIEYATSQGLATRLVTNGYWGTSAQRAERVVQRLHRAGLSELNISIDDYHLPYVDAARVRTAFEAARRLPFQAVILVHAVGPRTTFGAAELDALIGMSLPRLYTDDGEPVRVDPGPSRPFLAVSNTTVQAIGRGAIALETRDFFLDEGWEDRARHVGGCPWAVRSPAISPDGHLVACCGFEATGNPILDIGDLDTHSVGELLDKADDDVALNAIAVVGPYGIMDRLRALEPELPFADRYSGMCAVCNAIVATPVIREAFLRHLAEFVPAILAVREGAGESSPPASPATSRAGAADTDHRSQP